MVHERGNAAPDSAPVQFGIFDWIDRNQLPLPDLYEQRLQCLKYADEAGFYCYHLAEHQATPLGMAPSPGVFLAAATQRTRHIRLGPLVYLLPLYNPLRLAQEICMLDNMSRGRLELGVGRGVSPYELAFYQVTPQQARAMFREALDILLSALRAG
jgi:alkanesulfonate monooxygenase SsuD/methylene tetrahydromethanopterin reductase-like flavin-dependent oxidoreductase (luciferase family)